MKKVDLHLKKCVLTYFFNEENLRVKFDFIRISFWENVPYFTLFHIVCKMLTYKPFLCELNWLTTLFWIKRGIADLQYTTKIAENMKGGIITELHELIFVSGDRTWLTGKYKQYSAHENS